MNINININVTPGTTRRLAYLGVTLLIGGVAAVASAVPTTFMKGQKLTAEQLNQNFGDLEAKLTAVNTTLASKADKSEVAAVTSWKSYEPALTTKTGSVVPSQSTKGFYRRVGDSLEVNLVTTFTAAPNSGASWWQWSLPENLLIDLARTPPIGVGMVGSGSASVDSTVALAAYVRTAKGVSAWGYGASTPYLNDTQPLAFGNGSEISVSFTVPIVGWVGTP